MDLTTYAGLQATAADWLNRDDLTAQIPLFVQLVESKIRRRVRRKVIRSTAAFTSDTFQLPPDCAELRSARPVTGEPTKDLPLKLVTPEQLAELRAGFANVAGRPRFMSIVGQQLFLVPAPAVAMTVELLYFEKLAPLTGTNPTNSVLAEAPDIYLFGVAMEAAPYLQHDERIPVWEQKLETALTELDTMREREETSASIRPARLPVVFG